VSECDAAMQFKGKNEGEKGSSHWSGGHRNTPLFSIKAYVNTTAFNLQLGLVEDDPADGRGVGTRWSLRSLATLTILWFLKKSCF